MSSRMETVNNKNNSFKTEANVCQMQSIGGGRGGEVGGVQEMECAWF